ncbi:MAG: PQQ-binding-like beta-propeller repeat protein [Anaerolineae bacterium]
MKPPLSLYSSPAVADGIVYVGSGCDVGDCHSVPKQYLYAWMLKAARKSGGLKPTARWMPPAVAEGLVYFSKQRWLFTCRRCPNRPEKWQIQVVLTSPASPTVAAGVVYLNANSLYRPG